ncbi:hypothetical protein ACYRFS_02945 [Listeria kieliensis]
MENMVRFKIGEIEFETAGSAEVVEREREFFLSSILPEAVLALKKATVVSSDPLSTEIIPYSSETDKPISNLSSSEPINQNNDDPIENNSNPKITRTNLATFTRAYGDLSNQDFVLIAAYYDEFYNKKQFFTSEDVKRYYREARRDKYSNNSGLLRKLANLGYIIEKETGNSERAKTYIISQIGIDFIENYKKQEKPEKKKRRKGPTKKRTKKLESIYSDCTSESINLEKYPEFKNINSKDQILLAMYIFTQEKVGDTFSKDDLIYILNNIIGVSVSLANINNVFSRNKQWFTSEEDTNNKKASRWKLLQGAKTYVEDLIKKQ